VRLVGYLKRNPCGSLKNMNWHYTHCFGSFCSRHRGFDHHISRTLESNGTVKQTGHFSWRRRFFFPKIF